MSDEFGPSVIAECERSDKAAKEAGLEKMFERLTTGCARFTGRPAMFALCILLALGGVGAYTSGDDHFLNGANLSLSIVTLLLLPILQATQNRDGAALQAKLDELIKANSDARDALIGLERKGEQEIEALRRDGADEAAEPPAK